jgi:ADP-ribosylglycohydrolase
MHLSAPQLDRAAGAVVVSAAGDALGSQYEFGPALSDSVTPEFGVGRFGHEVAEWTDDTSMAMPVLALLADGHKLEDESSMATILRSWRDWSRTAKDVGSQTRSVLGRLADDADEKDARNVAEAMHVGAGRSGGNGSLMRTGPVALGYLDRSPAELGSAAGRIAQLTHWEIDNVDACTLWCLAVRHAILTGELDIRAQLAWIPSDRRNRWSDLIEEATHLHAHPRDFREGNGWVVRAFQAALAALSGATSPRDVIERAVRGGGDTDTVAAIAGSLAGATWGASALPWSMKRRLHGWPGLGSDELVRLACLAARHGKPDPEGWPSAARATVYPFNDHLFRHPYDDGVWIGSIAALDRLPNEVDAVVSLCRIGRRHTPGRVESVQIWLIDQDYRNNHLDVVLEDAVDAVATLRREGGRVFLHCAEGRSRTAAVAALYGVRHHGISLEQAWQDIGMTLPGFAPKQFLRDAVERLSRNPVAAPEPLP